jgi:uncharacterized protein (TIGR03086 family)
MQPRCAARLQHTKWKGQLEMEGTTAVTTMTTTTGELYLRAMAATQGIMEGVPADRWDASTPCTEWNARQVANHIIGENLWAAELFQGKTIAQVGTALEGDLTGDDPAGAYRRSVRLAQDAAGAPGAMQSVCHLSFGDYSGSDYAAQLFLDTLIHGWDIARATDQNTRLDPELVAACQPIAQELTRQFRQAGVFGEDLPVDADAEPQTRLLALLGRSA